MAPGVGVRAVPHGAAGALDGRNDAIKLAGGNPMYRAVRIRILDMKWLDQ